MGLAGYWVFQYLIKTPMLEVLPEGAYARWRPYSSPADLASVRQWILAACGVLGGALTHLVWDAFTHENARGVRMIPWLEEPIVEIGNHHMGGIRLMQDGSSLIRTGCGGGVGVVRLAARSRISRARPALAVGGAPSMDVGLCGCRDRS